ncbi:MAG: prephenate dehydratase [bacterium]|nr:prephenate dehydratase [bacterium]
MGEIDRQLIELISERVRLYTDEFKDKLNEDNLFLLADKEKILEHVRLYNTGSTPDGLIAKIYNEIIFTSINAVLPIKVAFLGPKGTFTNSALVEIFGETVEQVPTKTIPDVFSEVEAGNASYGVVPVENSTEGAVTYTLDELVETDLNIVAEKSVRISFALLSKSRDMEKIVRIYSHPQPVGQCKGWIRNNFKDIEIIHVDSTSLAAEIAAGEEGAAAIASEAVAELYGLNILANRIEDLRQNYTRFFAIGRNKNSPTGKDKTSIVCAIKDKPAALLDLLKPFSEGGINMTKIESRPDKKKKWEYVFFIDFLGHRDDREVKDALAEMKNETVFVKILGSYPQER